MIEKNHSIEANWVVNLLCNYHCSYCGSRADAERPDHLTLSPQEYAEFFDRSERTWMLCMTGGEPFIHQKVVEIMEAVSQRHFLTINTNGTQTQRLREFGRRVPPERVQSIHVGIHVDERSRMNGWEALVDNIRLLKRYGFYLFASVVVTSQVIRQFPALYAQLKDEADCLLLPKLVRDEWYPKAYTSVERELIRSYIDRILGQFPELQHEPYTVNPIHDRDYVGGFPDFRGHDCRAGVDFVRIDPRGTIWRCQQKERIGSLITGELNLHKQPYVCRETFCPYYCLKYSSLRGVGTKEVQARAVTTPPLVVLGEQVGSA